MIPPGYTVYTESGGEEGDSLYLYTYMRSTQYIDAMGLCEVGILSHISVETSYAQAPTNGRMS